MARSTSTNVVGAHDAKTNLGQLLDRVERHGETIVITRHGEPVARLVPFAAEIDVKRAGAAIERILKLQSRLALGKGLSVEDLINEGRET
jgi:prevent-host-death family protein